MADAATATPAPLRGTLPLGILFGLAFAAFFVGFYLDNVALRLVSKPVPVLCLIAWLVANKTTRAGLPFIVGLAFSVVGDVILEAPGAPFVGGLIAFLIAHLVYVGGALMESRRLALWGLLPIAAWCTTAYLFLLPNLGDMALPVAGYTTVIGLMGWRLAARVDGSTAAWVGLAGALLFMLSDTTLAVRKFNGDFTGGRELIMLTYWGGQALIAASVLQVLSKRG